MQDDRRLAVLRAIVEDYVATQEPVGSKALVERHSLGVSPATVRNDMAVLEEEGFITQPHTSAGRVPTDKGYRLFVDRLTAIKPMSAAEKRAIATILDGAVDLDDVVHRSVRLLSQLTHQVAVVQYPTLSGSTVRHIELVLLAPTRVLLVLILSTGRVEQRLVELDSPATDDELAAIRAAVSRAAVGESIADAAQTLRGLDATGDTTAKVVDALVEAMSDYRSDGRVVVAGTANLARFGDSFEVRRTPVAGGPRGARRAAQADRRGARRRAHRADRPRGALSGAQLHERGRHGLRPRGRDDRQPGHRRPDPDGLSRLHGGGACRRPLRLPHPRRGMRPVTSHPQTPEDQR